MKPNTAKALSAAISGIAVAFAVVLFKLTVGSIATPQELRKK